MNVKYLLLILLSCFTLGSMYPGIEQQILSKGWTVSIIEGNAQCQKLSGIEFPTSLPTTIHLDLLRNQKIKDPFHGNNYPTLKWLQQCIVKYTLNFQLAKQSLPHHHNRLLFEGIDTYSKVVFNGKQILQTENAFRTYSVQVEINKKGNNKLQVIIEPVGPKDDIEQINNPMPFEYAHTRKACYQYSWDWAPELITAGIWRPVKLQSYTEVKIDYVWVRDKFMSNQKAVINFAVALETKNEEKFKTMNYKCRITINGQFKAEFKLVQTPFYHEIEIKNPQFWWPHGIGNPNIYEIKVELRRQDILIDYRQIPYGIRNTQLNLQNQKFQVKINGYPIYCKGANYVPMDMFHPRYNNPDYEPGYSLQSLFEDIVDSNFNMIRLWGGGQYQTNKFLQMASRKGIMIFHDFMFSDSAYPSSRNFMQNVEEEVKQQIRRIRNYPCLTLWSGNNEILQEIQRQGWDTPKQKEDYNLLFEKLIPKIIEYESPYIPYIPSSPIYGVGNNVGKNLKGDTHFWGVWAAGQQFQAYKNAVSSFNSEFGTQSLPVWETIKNFTDEGDQDYTSNNLLAHERHISQFSILNQYMENYMRKSLNFQLQVYQSGLTQAYGIQIAIKAQRIAKPNCWGTLYWQLNDAWPAISWSSIDYFGRWKPLQYMAKRLYPNIAIFADENNVYAVNDRLSKADALARIEVVTLEGQSLFKEQIQCSLQANEAKIIKVIPSKITERIQAKIAIYTEIVGGKDQVMVSTTFLRKFKQLQLPEATLKVQLNVEFNFMVLSCPKVLKNVFISSSQKYLKLSDNYFDLIPGHPRKVFVKNNELNSIKDSLVFRSYRQVYKEENLKVKFI